MAVSFDAIRSNLLDVPAYIESLSPAVREEETELRAAEIIARIKALGQFHVSLSQATSLNHAIKNGPWNPSQTREMEHAIRCHGFLHL